MVEKDVETMGIHMSLKMIFSKKWNIPGGGIWFKEKYFKMGDTSACL